MPAPRAVLIDVMNKKLDPNVAYHQVQADGMIKQNKSRSVDPVHVNIVETIQELVDVTPTILVETTDTSTTEVPNEVQPKEEVVADDVDSTVTSTSEVQPEAPKKKGGFQKKAKVQEIV